MDATRRSRPADCAAAAVSGLRACVASALRRAGLEGARIAVALSGGRDSSALLDAAAELRGELRFDLVAFHVHHGLSAHADAWADLCRANCAALGVPLDIRRLDLARKSPAGIEAAARNGRYEALAELARTHAIDAVLLAHHADDQAETVLLQLLRGSGPRGLAAMPVSTADRGGVSTADRGVRWLRPLLEVPREAIDACVEARALRYVDDDSNADARHRRNALRGSVVPALRAIAPGYPRTLVRAARLQADAAALLDDLAAIDARDACDGHSLERSALCALEPRRAANLLRWFLRGHDLPAPSSARLSEMLRQLAHARDDAQVTLAHAGVVLGVHRGRIVVHRAPPDSWAQAWTGAGTVPLPHGTLRFVAATGAGIAARRLEQSRVTIRAGVPGERLRLDGRARRPVAELLREAGMPPWERLAVPRVYCDDTLAAVAGIGVDADFGAAQGEASQLLEWQPADR
ncbi:MAG TPA: tRNA lysidine(34) synthetase TilS [Casimicrobiaceae bacterium]